MRFKSKTELAQHINSLVHEGYLIPEWKIHYSSDEKTNAVKLFKVNYHFTVQENNKNG